MSDKTGGTVFPTTEANWHNENVRSEGMTIRDYFAGQELSKMYAVDCCDIPDAYARQAEHCYRMADAMLAARSK